MEKIAIISDIHSYLEALKTVLQDIQNKGIKRIFCLGDIIGKGMHPRQCIDLTLEHCELIVKGNLEEFVLNEDDLDSKYKQFYREQLGQSYMNKINNLPFCYELYISGSLVRFFHASPTSVFDRANVFGGYTEKVKLFYPSDKTNSNKKADIVVFGDLHTQFMEKFNNKTLINCGSVGNSVCIIRDENIDSDKVETTQAFYLIIEGEVGSQNYNDSLSFNFVRVPYDIEKELEDCDTLIKNDEYKLEIRNGIYRDLKKVKKQDQ